LKRFARVDLTVYYGDLLDHMNKICDSLDEGKDTIEVFKDADYTLSGYRANRVIRIMSIMLATALPFLVVASLFSMRIPLPGGLEAGSPRTFIILLIIGAVLAAIGLYTLRRRRLI